MSYHKIDNRREWGLNTVKPDELKKQIHFLKNEGYVAINFLDIQKGYIPEKPIIITFDDGYSSVFNNAFPILRDVGFTAVVFIITGFIGEWNTWDVNLGGIRFRHLNENQIKALSKAGWEIGAHGKTHLSFTRLSHQEIKHELEDSKNKLQQLTGQPIISLAYPFGIHSQKAEKIAYKIGFRFACVNLWGTNSYQENPMCLKRIPVYRTDSLKAFQHKLSKGLFKNIEFFKLRTISWFARLTPIYQQYSKIFNHSEKAQTQKDSH